jgi:hypothetical protein
MTRLLLIALFRPRFAWRVYLRGRTRKFLRSGYGVVQPRREVFANDYRKWSHKI